MEYLSEGEIIESLTQYIQDNNQNQAVLIDGEWGSGKTYFIKNTFIKKVEEELSEKKIIYISLYGKNTVEEIASEIYLKLISDKTKISEKTIEKASIFYKILRKIKNVDMPDIEDLSNFIEINNLIICFDDIERCSIGINDLLGYINGLVEHNNIKAILVANEAEIGKLNLVNNLEQKYSIILSNNLDLRKNLKNDDNTNTKYSEKELKEYTRKLFGEDILYKSIKEKLIGNVIRYEPNLESIFDEILDIYILDNFTKDIIKQNKIYIIKAMNIKNHNNIRTLKFVLSSFERIDYLLTRSDFDKEYIDNIRKEILNYCLQVSIIIKSGLELPKWDTESEVGPRCLEHGSYSSIYGYKFVETYLKYRTINNDHILNIISKLIEQRKNDKLRNKRLAISNLNGFFMLEDEEIHEYIEQLCTELKRNKYEIEEFGKIASLIVNLEEAGFKTYNIRDIMKEKAKKEEKYFQIDNFAYFSNKKLAQKFNEIILPINKILQEKEKNSRRIDINICLSTEEENWGLTFQNYCMENKEKLLQNKEFFCLLNIDRLIYKLEESKVKDIVHFINGINLVYYFSNLYDYFENDLNNLNELLIKIKNSEKICLNQNGIQSNNKTNAINELSKLLENKINDINKNKI